MIPVFVYLYLVCTSLKVLKKRYSSSSSFPGCEVLPHSDISHISAHYYHLYNTDNTVYR